MTSLDDTDPTFVDDLKESQRGVAIVAQWFRARGYEVTVPETHIRPNPDVRMDYSDSGDLFVKQRIEVKHRKVDFTCAADFPYPTILVDVAHSWDRGNPKAFAYFSLNKAGTHAALILCRDTLEHWIKTEKYDPHAGRKGWYYECPVEHVQFIKLAD
jgi:hypothetical protein